MSRIKNLRESFDDFSLDIPDLVLPDQGITVLWGNSGAGKSSFLKCLCGLHEPKGWTWEHQGEDLSQRPAHRRGIGFVPQGLALFPHLSGRDNIFFPVKAQGLKLNEALWSSLQEILSLKGFIDKKSARLSGGQRQRVALARAMLIEPKLLVLDEPFAALDYSLRLQCREWLKKLVEKWSIPALMVSHDPEDVRQMASSVFTMEDGRVTIEPSVEHFLEQRGLKAKP